MEQLNIAPEQTPAAGPNDAEMAAKGENAVQQGNTHNEAQNKQRPEWVPEKFWNPQTGEVDTEGLAKSYSELEKSRSQPKKADSTMKIESVADAQALATEKGIDFDALSKEYNTNGDLSEDSYKAIEAKGISRDVVRQFVEGQKAQLDNMKQDVFKTVGGEEKYQEMVSWAKTQMDPKEVAAYNKAVSSGDMDIIKLAVSALQSKYVMANGQPPGRQVAGKSGSGSSSNAEPFGSRQQYVDAIKDARYERDPAYRNQVMKRLEASQIF